MEVREASAEYLVQAVPRVPKGYKQTEVGVIPEDWDVVPLGNSLRRSPNYGINAPAIPFDSRYPTYLRITDITEDGRFAEATKASVGHPASSAYLLEPGDLVFARTGASVGKSYRYNPKDGRLVFAGFLIRITPDTERLTPAFLSFFVQTRTYWNWVKVNSMRSGQPGINGREYASLPIPLPPTKAEQEAIAEALSDADGLIESLEQLLVKKRQIKQGAMQVLLTGKKRLPGFSEEWEVKRLGELFEITSSKRVFQSEWRSEGIPFYRARELAVLGETGRVDNELFILEELYETHRRAYGVPQVGDMLVTGVGTLGKVYVVTDNREFYFKDGNIIWFKIGGKMSAEFLRQLYLTEALIKQIAEGAAGTTVGTYTITAAKKTTIPYPPFSEQTAIAAILSDMDGEIAMLEAKLAKARAIKQGMMQELLTGRIRLV